MRFQTTATPLLEADAKIWGTFLFQETEVINPPEWRLFSPGAIISGFYIFFEISTTKTSSPPIAIRLGL